MTFSESHHMAFEEGHRVSEGRGTKAGRKPRDTLRRDDEVQ